MTLKTIKDFRVDSDAFQKLTGKPLVLNSFMSGLHGRPVLDIAATKHQFKYKGSFTDFIKKPALDIINKYVDYAEI